MKTLVLSMTILALCSLAIAQDAGSRFNNSAAPSPLGTSACSWQYTTGSGNSFLQFCVSPNGNIVQFTTPNGVEQLAVPGATVGEGYGICNETPATEYHDYADLGDSGNWTSTVLKSVTATSVKLSRTTSDGIWTLTQTISIVPSDSSLKISMALTNNTATARVAYLVRYMDVSAGGRFLNTLDSTLNSAAAWNTTNSANPYGVILRNNGNPQYGYWSGFAQNISGGPNACAFAFNYTGSVLTATNGSVVMAYVTNIPAHATKTAVMSYRGM